MTPRMASQWRGELKHGQTLICTHIAREQYGTLLLGNAAAMYNTVIVWHSKGIARRVTDLYRNGKVVRNRAVIGREHQRNATE